MKKLLALVLALVMTLGLATVGANAAEFADQSDISYDEAVNVLSTVGVLGGVGDNKFDPKGELTRAAGAKIIAYLDLGEKGAEALPETQIFADVPASHWASKYIGYCYTMGYVGGVGNNNFNPDGSLSGYAFGKMLLVVLGYDAEIESLVGANWSINAARLMSEKNIAKGIESAGSATLTREEAAQYAFNALKATMVRYASKGTTITDANGLNIRVGASAAATYAGDGTMDGRINAETGGNLLQLGEKLYQGDLRRQTQADDMGRPGNYWTYKTATVIGTYPNTADYKVVVSKADQTVEDVIDGISKSFDDTTYMTGAAGRRVWINGVENGTTRATATQIGDIVEVFMDNGVTNQVDYVAVTRYSSAKLTGDVTTKGSGDDLEVRVPGVINSYKSADDVTGYTGLKKDDIVYYYTGDAGDTYHFAKATSFQGQLTAIKTASNAAARKYTISGSDYVINQNVANANVRGLRVGVNPVYNTTFEYYQDDNNFIVYAKQIDNTQKDYLVVNRIQYLTGTSYAANAIVQAELIKMDGTVEVAAINSIADGTNKYIGRTDSSTAATANTSSNATLYGTGTGRYLVFDTDGAGTMGINTGINVTRNMMFTYTQESDGSYNLRKASDYGDGATVATGTRSSTATATTWKTSSGWLGSQTAANGIAVNDETVFVVLDLTASSTKVKTFTGKNNCPDLTSAVGTPVSFVYASEGGVATHAYVYQYSDAAATGKTIFILGSSSADAEDLGGSSSFSYTTYPAYVDGEFTTVKVNGVTPRIGEATPTYNTDGVITALAYTTGDGAGSNNTVYYGYSMEGTTLALQRTTDVTGDAEAYSKAYNAPSTATVLFKDADGNYSTIATADIGSDANDQIYVSLTNGTDNTAKFIYIQQKADNENGISTPAYTGASFVANGSWNTANAKDTATIAGASTDYRYWATGASVGTGNITVTAKANSKLAYQFVTANGTTINWASATTLTNSTSNSSGTAVTETVNAGADGVLYVRVTAEDGDIAYYAIVIDT